MANITENQLEHAALDWLRDLGWQTAFGPDTGPAGRENVGADLRVCPNDERPEHTEGEHTGSPLRRVVQW